MSIGTSEQKTSALTDPPGPDLPAAPPGPGSFRVATQLMQDALPADAVSVGGGAFNQEALFANPFKEAREEALVIDSDNKLTYLERTDSSETGWRQQLVEDAEGTFAEVVVAVHPNGQLWAFCVPSIADNKVGPVQAFVLTVTQVRPDGTSECAWVAGEATDKPWVTQSVFVSYSPDAGPLVAGGGPIDGAYQATVSPTALSAQLPEGAEERSPWVQSVALSRITQGLGGRVVGGGFLPYLTDQVGHQPPRKNVYVFYTVYQPQQGRYVLARYEWSASTGQLTARQMGDSVKSLDSFCGTWNVPNIPHAYPQGDVGYVYLAANSDLVVGYGYGTPVVTSALGFESARSWQDADGKLHVFGINSRGALQVLHQASWMSYPFGVGDMPTMPVWTTAVPKNVVRAGIGDYDLALPQDRVFAFDYNSTGHADHLVLYRPIADTARGATLWVVEKKEAGAFEQVFAIPPAEHFQYPLGEGDQVLAFDGNSSGCLDHLVVYRPGPGRFFVLKRNGDVFEKVSGVMTGGIAGSCNLSNPADRMFAFDYNGTGKLDHLVVYRPGSRMVWIAQNQGAGLFRLVYTSRTGGAGDGIGDYDMADSRDQLLAFDFTGSGSADHLLAYRPGVGTVHVVAKRGNAFSTIADWNRGIGGYPLNNPDDRLVAYGYGDPTLPADRPDHLVAYRADFVWILRKQQEPGQPPGYQPVYASGDPGTGYPGDGIGGYDMSSPLDRLVTMDYDDSGRLDHLVAYRPGQGKISILESSGDLFLPVYQAPTVPVPVTVGLQADVAAFELDPYPDYKPSELIKLNAVTVAEAYCFSTQDVTTSGWATDKVRLPSAKNPHLVSHYVANVTLLDTGGTAMPERNVTVSADSLVEVQVAAVSYLVGPGRDIVVATDSLGRLPVSVYARGLSVPVIHLTTDGLPAGAAIDFAAPVNDYLSGTGTLPSQKGTFTASALENAQCTGPDNKKVPLVADWDNAPMNAEQTVHTCGTMYARAAGNGEQLTAIIDGFSGPQPVAGYVIQKWDPSRPSYQVFRTLEDVEAYRRYRDNHPAVGGWWDDFTNWASDVWEGIKTGAAAVAEVLVTAVVEIAVFVGNAVVRLGELIIEAVEQAVQAVEAVFQMIADAVMRVIDWLKALFDFHDIWDTKRALQGMLLQMPRAIRDCSARYGQITNDWLKEQARDVHDRLMDLKVQYGDTRIGDFGNKAPATTTSDGAALRPQEFGDNPQANWAQNKFLGGQMQAHLRAGLDQMVAGAAADVGEDAFFEKAKDLFGLMTGGTPGGSPLDHLKAAASAFADAVAGMIEGALGDAHATGAAPIAKLIDAIDELIQALLTFLEIVVKKAFELLDAFGAGLEALLTSTLDLGPINTIWGWIMALAGHPDEQLTIGNFFCLIAAFPVTIIYKLIVGVDHPPFPGGVYPVYEGLGSLGTMSATGSPFPGLDGGTCYGFNLAASLLTATVYNGLEIATNWYTDNSALNWAYWFFSMVSFCGFCWPFTYSPYQASAWWSAWTVWVVWSALGAATIKFGNMFPVAGAKNAPVKQFGDWLGGAIALGVGSIAMAASIVASVNEDDPAQTLAAGILGCPSTMTGIMIPVANMPDKQIDPKWKRGWLTGKSVIDLFCNAACGILGTVYDSITIAGRVQLAYVAGDLPWDPGSGIAFLDVGMATSQQLTATASSLPLTYAVDPSSSLPAGISWQEVDNQFCLVGAPTPQTYSQMPIIWAQDSNSYPPFQTSYPWALMVRPTPVKSMEIYGGNDQDSAISTVFASQLSVIVTGDGGRALPGALVVFTAPDTDASGYFVISGTTTWPTLDTTVSVITDNSGVATAPPYLANDTTGANQVTAAVVQVTSVTFDALNNTAATAASASVLAGNNQTAFSGNIFTTALQVSVLGGNNQALASAAVTFSCPADQDVGYFYAGPGQAGPTSVTVITDSQGTANAGLFQAATITGSGNLQFTITAVVAGTVAATAFTLTIQPAPSPELEAEPRGG